MRRNSTLLLVSGALLLSTAVAVADQHEAAKAEQEMKAMMEGYQKLAQPGPHHEHLAPLVGSWDYTIQFFGPAGSEPMESTGTMETKWLLGGRFLYSESVGSFMEIPFQGIGIDGYDTINHRYIGYWIDSMGTYAVTYTGTCGEDGKVRTMHGSGPRGVSRAPIR